ncbi:glycoside hydrolase family 97 protein [Bacteroides sp. 224]|uniref:glycoside hydrolase family 97 protein n=1 Tax=Bacteroides sp. 224 TaxID=2302936 RepID=UPI0013D3D580|nr:glycoside hydrolase family 97 protein [Bacteroides sp. 224]NDV64269.1 glycoside hydrolase family 97 protein [Bacteroides sp. 224]
MKKISLFLFLCFYLLFPCLGKKISVSSPDKRLVMELDIRDQISYRVTYKGTEIIAPSRIDIELSNGYLGENAQIKNTRTNSVKQILEPPYGKFKQLTNHYKEVIIDFENNYSLIARAYNEGVAYRFVTKLPNEIVVNNEIVEVNLTGDPAAIFPETDNYTAWELMYIDYASISAITEGKRTITPVLFSEENGTKVIVAESDVRDYPGMYLKKNKNGFQADFASYPDSTAIGGWGFVSVVQRTRNYIAKTSGTKEFPWRIIMATDDDRTLLTNELIYKLAKPSVLKDILWVKPGKAAWEWWHDAMLPGIDLPSGMDNRNTALYKYYVDFAAQNNLEYLMIDAGWSDLFDLSKVNPKVDINEIINYARSKNVGVFLWCTAISLTDRADEYLQMMNNWGVAGIKVDFFDRDDQQAMQWYETIAEKAAKYKLMVNFHGCSKPTGLQRTYPNILNFEAVRGEECSKWDLTANPQHHLTFPFIRMLGGPLDYTPGALRNRSFQMFKPVDPGLPMAQGTRCHHLALFVILDQYFAMLCDSPAEYIKYPDIMSFLSKVPVTFDDTKVLSAKVGEYALMAKQKGDEWFVGGMTNWTARNMTADFSFLPAGKKYKAEIFKDGDKSYLYADQYVFETAEVNADTKLTIPLSQGGGFVIHLYPN